MQSDEFMQEPDDGGVVDAALVTRALGLLDGGSIDDARALLAAALSEAAGERPWEPIRRPSEGFDPIGDAEFDSAFEDARPETDSMIDADGIAFEAILRAKLDAPEAVSLPAADSPFHTRTMADLLERQGDFEGARAIRAALEEGGLEVEASAESTSAAEARTRSIRTLERWLERLRGGDA